MKKKILIVGIIIVLLYFVIRIIITFKYAWYMVISRDIEVEVPFSVELECKDTHGGFHGDGESLVKAKFSEEEAEKFKDKIEKNEHWKKLPMPEKLNKIAGAYVNEEMVIPMVQNGYFFFLDRHSEADDKYNFYEMYEEFRASANYTVAVFDTDENILYFYELDT